MVVSAGGGVATGFFDIFIALVIAFWALKDLPKLREEILLIAGPKFEGDAELLIGTVTKVVGGYLKGQTIASFVTGSLVAIGLAIFDVPYALVLGIITFVLQLHPVRRALHHGSHRGDSRARSWPLDRGCSRSPSLSSPRTSPTPWSRRG